MQVTTPASSMAAASAATASTCPAITQGMARAALQRLMAAPSTSMEAEPMSVP